MPNKKILIADDERQTTFCISLALRMRGYDTVVAEDGEKALQIIRDSQGTSGPIDCLVCDIQMPKVNGEELIDNLNALNIKIPTLVVTGFGEKELVVRLMRKGCRDFIDKPFEPAEIEERVGMIFAEERKNALEKKRIETMAKVGLHARQLVHDMNNVLGGTIGYADMALDLMEKDHPTYSYLTKIFKTASRAAEICKTLLAATRCTETPVRVPTEMNSLTQRVAEIIKDIVPENITIETKTDTTPLWCTVNAERVQQALLNLGINGAQAMPEGGVLAIQCVGGVEKDSHIVTITVSDTGQGIPRNLIDKIFEPGFTTKKGGNGIGLPTVKEIVEEHKGTLRVDSTAGKGTTFTIDLPEREATSASNKRSTHEDA
jgi:signal transduction histidine kinase